MEGLKVKFGVLEKTIWILENPGKVLEKSLKFVSEKGHAPCYLCVWTCVTTDERALGTLSMVVCGVKPGCAQKRGHEAKRKQESLFVAKKAAVRVVL